MAVGPSSGATKKSQRPVLSSHLAHAHAFAVVPTPGGPTSARGANSYFPLPTPPTPLRTFALSRNGDSARGTEGKDTNSYPNSTTSSQRDANFARLVGERGKEARSTTSAPDALEQNALRRTSKAGSNPTAYSHSSASVSDTKFHFASAVPFSVNDSGSPYVSSPRSALSIAEIDCFFVQGLRPSTYSAHSHSPRSQSATKSTGRQSDHSNASLSDFALSSNDEAVDGDNPEKFTIDHEERERQRAERQAFMKARKEMREELRRKKRLSRGAPVDELCPQTQSTWREAIKSQESIALNDIPKTRERKRAGAANSSSLPDGTPSNHRPDDSVEPVWSSDMQPPPSGPGPPVPSLNHSTSHDNLADTLAANLTLSSLPSYEVLEDLSSPAPNDKTPRQGDDPTPALPVLSRFDSDETEVASSPQPSQT